MLSLPLIYVMLCLASEAAAALRTHERMDGCGMPPAMTGSFLGLRRGFMALHIPLLPLSEEESSFEGMNLNPSWIFHGF